LSKRRQGKATGGRSARHHEAQEGTPLRSDLRHERLSRAELEEIGRRGAEMSIEHYRRRKELEKLGFVEHRLTAEEMLAEVAANPEAAAAMGIELTKPDEV
jgi:hypothetical protein